MTSLATAAVDIAVDGERCRDLARLRSVRVASRLSQPAQCELVFDLGNGDQPWPSGWRFGSGLTVQVVGDDTALFVGEVTCVELEHLPDGTAAFRVRAYDLLHRLRKRQQPQVFEGVTAADLLNRLTGDLGVGPARGEAGPRLDRVVQHRQTDFDLLVEVATAAGLYLVMRGDELRLLSLAGYGDPVELRRGTSLWDLKVSANLDRVTRRVTALGWHSQRGEFLRGPAADPRTPRVELAPDPAELGVAGERFLVNRTARSGAHLAALAQAALDRDASRAVTVSGVADGDAHLWAGSRIALAGVAAQIAGDYVVASAVHTVDANGYQTTFSTELPEPAPGVIERDSGGIALGKVTDVDDPDGGGRVRVVLPAHGDLDAGWLGVLCPGAGQGRGLVVLPDVGDTVVVALPGHAPADGIVLGSVFGTVRPTDTGVEGGSVRRWSMRTAGGQSVIVDDSRRLVRVENHAGSVLELGPDLLRLHAATDLVIEAPGKAITVRAASVDFEHAPIDLSGST